MLKFKGAWRFDPPDDGKWRNREIPQNALVEFIELINRVATQGERWDVLEHYKGAFCRAIGSSHVRSSSESWAETDLHSYMGAAAHNAPLFLEAFFDASESLSGEDFYAPDAERINALCIRYEIGYEIRPPVLLLRESAPPMVRVADPPPTLAEEAIGLMSSSLQRSEQLLADGRWREAVHESLWLLESVSTAFRGAELPTTGVIQGKYFNQIAKELQRGYRGTALERVIDWTLTLHGYLSSPTGGGIRHGMDLNKGIEIGPNEARLFCNLIRSYLSYFLTEHERIALGKSAIP
jgi:hypothetical protein